MDLNYLTDKSAMRFVLLFSLIAIASIKAMAQPLPSLESAVKDYQSLEKEIDKTMSAKIPGCNNILPTASSKTYCSLKDLCTRLEIKSDQPIRYKNDKGEIILNEMYYALQKEMRTCFIEKNAEQIKVKKEEMIKKLASAHLKKIIDANKKLNQLINKFNQAEKVQKISSEILTMSLELGLNNKVSAWEMNNSARIDLNSFIEKAEKRTKIKLNSEIKKTLVEIQFLKGDNQYLQEVASLEKSLFPEIKPNDLFYDRALLLDEKAAGGRKKLALNREKLQAKTQAAYEIFKETQNDMLAYLESKKNENNFKSIERIIERVKTIRFNPPTLTKNLSEHCGFPNAFYSPFDHSFTICPEMLEMPKMALVETIAHEMAHSFDSCNYSGRMYKTHLPPVMEEAPFEIDIKMDPVSGSFSNRYFDEPKDINPKFMIQDKAIYTDHPFSKTISCLQDPKSVNAKAINPDEINKNTKKALDELTELGQNNPNNSKARKLNYLYDHQKEYFDYAAGCNLGNAGNSVGQSQLQEAFADKISSEIVALKLKTLSKNQAELSVLEIALSYDGECSNELGEMEIIKNMALKEGCTNFFENQQDEQKILQGLRALDPQFDPHPNTEKRIERNLLAQPDIRKALNCAPDNGVKYCE